MASGWYKLATSTARTSPLSLCCGPERNRDQQFPESDSVFLGCLALAREAAQIISSVQLLSGLVRFVLRSDEQTSHPLKFANLAGSLQNDHMSCDHMCGSALLLGRDR